MSSTKAKAEKEYDSRQDLEFTLITGLSGAGKSEAIHYFEDLGYFCIDNLPPALLRDMAKLGSLPGSRVKKIAVVSDVRGGKFFHELSENLRRLKRDGIRYQILFLEASDASLVKRFKETRRRHPLAEEGQIIEGIRTEREMMKALRAQADIVIDTSDLRPGELRSAIRSVFLGERRKVLLVTVLSFGYKYGIPLDADLVMDVRFLPNPHYVPELGVLTGEEDKVKRFVLERDETQTFLRLFHELLDFLLPHYIAEGKSHLTISIGCTGGTHRSVVLAAETAAFLSGSGYHVTVRHRDVGKELA